MRAAADQWERLSERTQFRLIRAVAQRRGPAFKKMFPNVVGIGTGYRTVGEASSIRKEFCLRFLVKRKWEDRRNRQGKIPSLIQAYWNSKGRLHRVLIPTDVSLLYGRPHQSLDLTDGIVSFDGAQPIEYGSASCLVHRQGMPNERYLLSCYHIFVPSMTYPRPDDPFTATDGAGSSLGSLSFAADPSRTVDAALLQIVNQAAGEISLWGCDITRVASSSDFQYLPYKGPFTLYARRATPPTVAGANRTAPLPVSLVGYHDIGTTFPYGDRSFDFGGTIQYQAPVRPGDSGCPLLDSDGTLFGMHFFGNSTEGYALAAPSLFADGVFEVDIEM